MPTSSPAFAHLFEPLQLRGKRLKNRIMSSGHDTSMPTDNLVNDQLIAYHTARAEGGVGLIVLQVAGVHDSARYTSHVLMATDDACIEGYQKSPKAATRMARWCCRRFSIRVGKSWSPAMACWPSPTRLQPCPTSGFG